MAAGAGKGELIPPAQLSCGSEDYFSGMTERKKFQTLHWIHGANYSTSLQQYHFSTEDEHNIKATVYKATIKDSETQKQIHTAKLHQILDILRPVNREGSYQSKTKCIPTTSTNSDSLLLPQKRGAILGEHEVECRNRIGCSCDRSF